MSTLRVSTIQDTAGSNSSTPAAIANGICKAWVNFNGTGTVAIRAQYNVSSITDNGTGDYTLNFTTAMTDANYSAAGIHSEDLQYANSFIPVTYAASSFRFHTREYNTGNIDAAFINVAIFR